MKRYLKDSIENMRDIGGYIGLDNFKIKEEHLIRSNLPDKLSENDIAFLKKMGIKCVIDLRSKEERKERPSVFENYLDFSIHPIEMVEGREVPSSSEGVPKSYIKMLEKKETIKEIFNIIKSEEKVLYFCNAGKDRTGVITALILQTLGVKKEDIIKDYVATREYLKTTLENYAKDNLALLNIIMPKEEYMIKYFEYFEEKYKTIENYLNLIGLSSQEISQIREKYLMK